MKDGSLRLSVCIEGSVDTVLNEKMNGVPDDEPLADPVANSLSEMMKRYKVNPGYVLREIGGEYILIPVGEHGAAGNRIISLNETAAFIFSQYARPKTAQEVLHAVKDVYEDNPLMEQHIREYTSKFLENGLIREE